MDPTYGGNLWVTSPGTVGFHRAGFAALRHELEVDSEGAPSCAAVESTQRDGNGNEFVDSEVAPPLAAVESTQTDGNGNGNVDSEVAPPLAAVESTQTDGNGENVDSEVALPLAVVETIQTDNSGNEDVDSEVHHHLLIERGHRAQCLTFVISLIGGLFVVMLHFWSC